MRPTTRTLSPERSTLHPPPGGVWGDTIPYSRIVKPEACALTLNVAQVACGGKLYQLVVQDEVTGKDLLSKGQLRKRVTIIPLNKIEVRL